MKRIPTLAFLALLAASPLRAQLEANAPWPMFRHDVEHTGRSGYAGPSLPILSWSYTAEGAIHASPSIGFGGRAVAAFEGPSGGHATICAFVPDGSLRWSYATGSRWHHSSPAIGVGGEIVIGTSDFRVLAIRSDGTLGWEYHTGLNVNSSPAIGDSGRVYVGSCDNLIYALDSAGALAWSYRAGDLVESSPALGYGERVYVGSKDNRIYALRSDGTRFWSYRTRGDVYSSPALGYNTVYAGSDDSMVYALHWTGTLKWSYFTGAGGMVWSSPALGGDETVYTGSSLNQFYAFGSNGSLRWSYQMGNRGYSSPAVGSDGVVYTGSWDCNIYAFGTDGSLAWSYTTAGALYSSPAIGRDGRLYAGSHDKTLYCIGPTPTPYPTFSPITTPTPTPDRPDGGQGGVRDNGDHLRHGGRVAADRAVLPVRPHPDGGRLDALLPVRRRVHGLPVPYLGFAAGTITTADPIRDYQALSAGFSGVATGTYILEGGAVDMTKTTSADNLVYFGTVDREELTVR